MIIIDDYGDMPEGAWTAMLQRIRRTPPMLVNSEPPMYTGSGGHFHRIGVGDDAVFTQTVDKAETGLHKHELFDGAGEKVGDTYSASTIVLRHTHVVGLADAPGLGGVQSA